MSDETSIAITFIHTDGGNTIVQRIPGFWSVPFGRIAELGGDGENRH